MLASVVDLDERPSVSRSDIPMKLLQAELHRRQNVPAQPACGSGGARGTYNTSIHVFALVLILVLSTAACSFPILVRRVPRLPVPHHFLFLARHFGTGVLIATAFVHLLPTAFVSLTDPCLPPFWNKTYPAMAGLIAMSAVFVVVGIEMFFATRGAGHIHGSEYDIVPDENGHVQHKHRDNGYTGLELGRKQPVRPSRQGPLTGGNGGDDLDLETRSGSSEQLPHGGTPISAEPAPSSTKYQDDDSSSNASDLELDDLDPTALASASTLIRRPSSSFSPSYELSHPQLTTPSSPASQQKLLLQCLLLEAGILFHSVFIGIALSVATSTPFLVLLLAISFHQTFEGLALGSRISNIAFPPHSPKPWLMALAYGTTTPIGQAIGLAVHGLYDPAGQGGLLMVGGMNALSSGLLLFAGLVELLAEDFLSERSLEGLRGKRRGEACGAVVAGAGLMAVVGAWA